jgi:hypothetical protein
MPAPGTQFAGPLISGPQQYADNNGNPPNVGLVELTQTLTLLQNSTNNVSGTFTIPEHCQITEFLIDNRVVWNSATSAGLTIGIAALGTEYMSSVNLLAAGLDAPTRVRVPGLKAGGATTNPVPTAAQLLAMKDTGTNKSVVATVAVVGATSTGETIITMRYIQTTAWMSP